jgi:NADPH-dependent curcumin reductase CurA
LKELGCDVALNYKDPNFQQDFATATPDYIDLYFDNVGGEILDLALARANKNARFVMCGAISQYNKSDIQGPKNYINIIRQRIRMEGFIVLDFSDDFPKARRELGEWLENGQIKSQETIVKGGLRFAEEGLRRLFAGENTGKMLVEIKSPSGNDKD